MLNGAMKGAISSPVSAAMEDAFGCAVMNRFSQLLDDEADPFDILREAEERKIKKKKEELKKGNVTQPKSGKRETQRDRKFLAFPPNDEEAISRISAGQKRPPRSGSQPVQNENRGTEAKIERNERRVIFRENRQNDADVPVEFSVEMSSDRYDRPMRGRGAGRGGFRGRGRGGFQRNFDGFDQRGKREFERHSGSDRAGIRPEEKRGGSGPRNWGSVKDEMSETEQNVPVEEAPETEASENPDIDGEGRGVDGEVDQQQDVAAEMSLDEWKALQEQSKPKAEFNIRKPDTKMPSKAFVIHISKYINHLGDVEDRQIFRRPTNDITSQLDINFGNLSRPSRGGRGGRGRGRAFSSRPEAVAQAEVAPAPAPAQVQALAPNPDDPEDFPALS
ncbi:intracellular hyaluronan-binding protein 4 isoform X1 [Erpetoichthys calabaricus]|uniref:Hyaluronan binding protein 4 n=1 Tax=Erpetoichthys calabaricus TaxID=27687 RepID=A0A8C4RXP1_ERPCA|nr:intracellular hyaluronan-binding protein 4 isoform X1 [Erpetoichthys calabaricus]